MRRFRSLVSAGVLVLGTLVAATPTLMAGPAAHATAPGADGRIAFVRANQIYTMTATGKGIVKLTSAGKNYRPEWSPDGRRIAYIHEVDGRRAVWVMTATGSGKRAVTAPGTVASSGVTWSPDGRTIAYGGSATANPDPASALMLVPSTGRNAVPRVVTGYGTGGYCDEDPPLRSDSFFVYDYLAWSPEVAGRSQIAVKTNDCYYDWAISMYHPDTGEFAQVMQSGADSSGYLMWTDLFFGPTGQFGYTEQDRGDFTGVMGPRLIVYPGFASRHGDTGGSPSPSGRFMAFTNNASGTAYVMRADVDGTRRQRLTVGYQPDWGVRVP
ncbi:PD40 domain-containing protein [Nocardioides sp. URHA0032]|uniref:PD40 domain-containing protein n=1 Tax=Nocardioides sp. URHA0032 TaxID=1380388 RepID=UPI00048CAB2A|nr:PD40 domain-containing protein [Nocardioides sp. URHA0032]